MGLRARGGFDVSMEWKGGKLQWAEVSNRNGGACKVRYGARTMKLSVSAAGTTRLNTELIEIK